MADNFLMKKIADVPVWGWGIIGIAGIGVGYFIIHRSKPAIPTGTQASDPTAGNVLPDQTPAALQPTNNPVGPGDPFMSVPTGNGTVPVLPNGYNPIYDANGNLTGYQAPPAPPSATPPGSMIFKGPTGVLHYQVQQGETLSSIASKFGLHSWNDVYAIPANQSLLGKMSAAQARSFMPRAGTVITLPSTAIQPGVLVPVQS